MSMSFGKSVLVAWGAWIGTLLVGSVVVLLLDKPEWRTTVGILSILLGFLAFVFVRRTGRRRRRKM
jgi:hypothetical protein